MLGKCVNNILRKCEVFNQIMFFVSVWKLENFEIILWILEREKKLKLNMI